MPNRMAPYLPDAPLILIKGIGMAYLVVVLHNRSPLQ